MKGDVYLTLFRFDWYDYCNETREQLPAVRSFSSLRVIQSSSDRKAEKKHANEEDTNSNQRNKGVSSVSVLHVIRVIS